MQMAHHIQAIQEDLAGAAAVAPDEATAEAGRRLSHALASSLHLRLLDVVTEVAAELSATLPGRVDVRLAGREPELVYVDDEAAETAPAAGADNGPTPRITLPPPAPLKAE